MRIVVIEEHVGRSEMIERIPPAPIAARGWPGPDQFNHASAEFAHRLTETADERVRAMDEAGVMRQVLSIVGPGADMLPAAGAAAFAAEYDDYIARTPARRGASKSIFSKACRYLWPTH